MQFGLKLGSTNINYTEDILSFFKAGYFQYIELFTVPSSFNDNIVYWKKFSIPIIIHAPHSFAGMNISLPQERENNKKNYKRLFNLLMRLNRKLLFFIQELMVKLMRR